VKNLILISRVLGLGLGLEPYVLVNITAPGYNIARNITIMAMVTANVMEEIAYL